MCKLMRSERTVPPTESQTSAKQSELPTHICMPMVHLHRCFPFYFIIPPLDCVSKLFFCFVGRVWSIKSRGRGSPKQTKQAQNTLFFYHLVEIIRSVHPVATKKDDHLTQFKSFTMFISITL